MENDQTTPDPNVETAPADRARAAMNLAAVIAGWRWAKRMTLRDASLVIGISHSTMSRLERGQALDGHSLRAVLCWLLTDAKEVPNGRAV